MKLKKEVEQEAFCSSIKKIDEINSEMEHTIKQFIYSTNSSMISNSLVEVASSASDLSNLENEKVQAR